MILQAGVAATLAAGTVDLLGEYRPSLVASIGRTAGSVAAVMFVATLLVNVPNGANPVTLATTLIVNPLGTGIETVIGLYLYRRRSSALKIGNTSSKGDTQSD